jgi:type IV secretion system protein VirB1
MARWLTDRGHSFDAGLAQVNSANLTRLGLDVASVFATCANLRAASRILGECHERAGQRWRNPQRRLAAALSCYNTGHLSRGIQNGYAAAVLAALRGAPGPRVTPRPIVSVPFPDDARRPDVFALTAAGSPLRAPERVPSPPQHP